MMWKWHLLSLVLMVGSLVVADVKEQEAEKVTEEFVQELKAKIQESVQTIDEVFGKVRKTREASIISRRSVGRRGWGDFFKGVAAGGLLLGKKDSQAPIISRSVTRRGWSDFLKGAAGVAAGGLLFGKRDAPAPIISRFVTKRSWSDFFKGAASVAVGGLIFGKRDVQMDMDQEDSPFRSQLYAATCKRGERHCQDLNYDSFQTDLNNLNKRKETAEEKQFKADLSRVSEAIDFLKGVVDVAMLGA